MAVLSLSILVVSTALITACGDAIHTGDSLANESLKESTASVHETIEGLYITFISGSETAKFRHHSGDVVSLNSIPTSGTVYSPIVRFSVEGFEATDALTISLISVAENKVIQEGTCTVAGDTDPVTCATSIARPEFETYSCADDEISSFNQPKAGTYEVHLNFANSFKRSVVIFPDPCAPVDKANASITRQISSVDSVTSDHAKVIWIAMATFISIGLALAGYFLFRRRPNV